MKNYVLLFITLTTLSCSTFFNRNPANTANTQKPRHVIITVHGLSGDETTWGSFNEVTQHYLPMLRPDREVVISNFLYPTGKSEKYSTMDFANMLNNHIEGLFKDRPLQPEDRISFVGHSQGGVVSYIWFFSRILDDSLEQKYMRQVDSIITLGTPFWGSKLASMLTDKNIPDIIPLVRLFADGLVTRKELVDMSFGSDVIHKFRQIAIKMDTDPSLEQKIESLPIRLINIMGVLPANSQDVYIKNDQNVVKDITKKIVSKIYELFQDKSGNTTQIESDVAVMVPSGRWDFIYAKPQIITAGGNTVSASQFTHFNHLTDNKRSKFFFTESVHLPFDTNSTLSMAYISKSCLAPEQCAHPTYRYILEELANCSNEAIRCDMAYADELNAKMKIHRSHVDEKGNPISDYNAFKNISKNLQTFTIQVEMKLKPGMISAFPVKYFTRSTLNEMDVWTLREPSLLGKVINLKRNGNDTSKASTDELTVYIAPKTERRGIDIVSKEAKTVTDFDIIRINVVGYVKYKTAQKTTAQMTTVPLSINLPGQPAVDIEAVIQPGYSTYLPLDYTKLQ
ncbi:MAG: hypothetical protein H7256_06325 [Bdellovibrio sp.]|nr:hypothetical protein [Bdellovibrio sp.]